MSVWLGGFGGKLVPAFPGVTSPPWQLYLKLNDLSAGGLSFLDGDAEIKRWRDPRTTPPVRTRRFLC